MSQLNPDRVFRRLAKDARLPVRDRIVALNAITRPSLGLLRSLLAKEVPPKLQFRAAQLYAVAIARRNLLRRNAHAESSLTQTDNR